MQVRKSIFQDLGKNYTETWLEDHFLAGGSAPPQAVVSLPGPIVRCHTTEVAFARVGRIEKAVEFIHRNTHRPFRMKELLEICAMPKRMFEQEFVAKLGIDPYSFINRCRVERACMLLRGPVKRQLKEVASISGFSGTRRFRIIFRRLMGVSPSVYQRANGTGSRL